MLCYVVEFLEGYGLESEKRWAASEATGTKVLRIGNLFKCLIRFQCKFNELPTKTEEVNVDGAEE